MTRLDIGLERPQIRTEMTQQKTQAVMLGFKPRQEIKACYTSVCLVHGGHDKKSQTLTARSQKALQSGYLDYILQIAGSLWDIRTEHCVVKAVCSRKVIQTATSKPKVKSGYGDMVL